MVTFGRLGDMFGRVKIYDARLRRVHLSSILLSVCPYTGVRGAQWLIGWRLVQALGGSMLTANSVAILTDAFPSRQRGFALGLNQVAALAGMFVGLVAGGLLAAVDWRLVFWVNVPVGVFGTLWAYWKLREISDRQGGRVDWWGNLTFAVGLGAILGRRHLRDSALRPPRHGLDEPDGRRARRRRRPLAGRIRGDRDESGRTALPAQPLPDPRLHRRQHRRVRGVRGPRQPAIRAIIWLQGIWLPLHGYSYSQTPLWAGIFLLPLTAGFLISGPLAGTLSDRFGSRGMATAGRCVRRQLRRAPVAAGGLPLWAFALLIATSGIGSGMFAAPNTSSIMSTVPARFRGAASGMRATFQNSGTALSIGIFFSLMIAGLSGTLSTTLSDGLQRHGVTQSVAHHVSSLPPVASLFAALLGVNPIQHLLAPRGALSTLSDVQPAGAHRPHLLPTADRRPRSTMD